MDDDDRTLLERIQKGDGESFGILYDRTRGWLLSCVIRPRVGPSEADDVLSETYRAALARIHEFQWRGVGLLHWLSAIARRKCLEHRRRDEKALARQEPLPAPLELPADAPTREAEMICQEALLALRTRVGATLATLPPRYAQALTLRLLEGRERAACAAALGVSIGTFDVVLFRATRAFAKNWSAHEA